MFNVGDRVEMVDPDICDYLDALVEGTRGTVLIDKDGMGRVGVRWDFNVGGHTLHGKCADGYGWWVPAEACELCDPDNKCDTKPRSSEDLFAFLGI